MQSSPGPSADVTAQPGEEGSPAVVEVTVVDEFETRIPRAHVVLAETSFFGDTNKTGVVVFANVPAGSYLLRVDAEHFQTLEQRIDVQEAQTLQVLARMVPKVGYEAVERSHFHDYWAGRRTVTLFEDVPWQITCVVYAYPCVKDGEVTYGYHGFKFPAGAIVYPGAGTFTLKIKWNNAPNFPLGAIIVYPGGSKSVRFATSGESASIDLELKNTDPPHATSSRWYFHLNTQATDYAGVWQGPLYVSASIERGNYELPYDPPHPDYWKGRARVPLDERNFTYSYVYANSNVCPGVPGGSQCPYYWQKFPAGRVVYPGADRVVFRVWTNETASSGPLVLEHGVNDYWGGSGQPVRSTVRAPDVTATGYREWRVPVSVHEFDDVYVAQSKWVWKVRPADLTTAYPTQALQATQHVVVDAVKGA